ncbi:MAG: tetratricopeptide repeat protein [Pyrinomonadaceae bacterium]
MKNVLLPFFLFLLLPITAPAQQPGTEALIATVKRLDASGEHSKAIELLKKAIAVSPNNPALHFNYGLLTFQAGDYQEAVSGFRKTSELLPDSATARTLLCRALWKDSQTSEALVQCGRASELDSNDPEPEALLVVIKSDSGIDKDSLISKMESLLEGFPDNNPLLLLAAEFFQKIDVNRSIELFQRLMEKMPLEAEWPARLATIYRIQEKVGEEIEMLRRIIEIKPSNFDARMKLARAYENIGAHPETIETLESALEIDERSSSAHHLMGSTLLKIGRIPEAVEHLRHAVDLAPEDVGIRFEYGRALISYSKYELAVEQFQNLYRSRPNDIAVIGNLGLTLVESARYLEAITILQKADSMDPGNDGITQLLRVARGRYEGLSRLDSLIQEVEKNPKNSRALMDVVMTLAFARRLDEAKPFIEKFWESNPTEKRHYQIVAIALATAGDLENAKRALKASLALEENPGAYFNLADLYKKQGKSKEAIEAFENGFRLFPNAGGFRQKYGDFLFEQARYQESYQQFKKSLEIDSSNIIVIASAGFLAVRLGLLDEAEVYLETLRARDPNTAGRLERCIRWKRFDLQRISN